MDNASVSKETERKVAGSSPSKGRKEVLSAPRPAGKLQAPGSPTVSWIAWGPNPCRPNSRPEEVTAGSRCPKGSVNEPTDQKEDGSQLPPIKSVMGRSPGERRAGVKTRNMSKFTYCTPAPKPFQKQDHLKSQPLPPAEVTPWVKPSPSECSLTSLLRSIASLSRCSEKIVDQPKNLRNASDIPNQDRCISRTPPPEYLQPHGKNSSQTKQRSRIRAAKRRTLNKLYGTKLPPVPAPTDLSFSRNFSFSFFELPEHQSPQQRLQRQRMIHITMKLL